MLDITDSKQAQEAFKESERHYRELFEKSRDGFVFVDINGRFIDANQAYCQMLGYSIDELKKMPNFYEITPLKWHEWERKEIWEKRLLQSGYSGIYEKEYIRKDGTVFPVELRSYVIFDENNNPQHLWGIVRDITERKRIENNLRLHSLTLNQISDIITVTDLEGNITYINETACLSLGKTKR